MPFWQKRGGMTLLPGDFLCGVFGNGVVLGTIERWRVADVKLFLPRFGFTFRVFHRHASSKQMIAQWPHHMLFFCGLQDMVILIIATDRGEVLKPLFADLFKGFLEQKKF